MIFVCVIYLSIAKEGAEDWSDADGDVAAVPNV